MAGNKETRQFNSSAKEKGFLGRGKDKALLVAEKSTPFTLALTWWLYFASRISLEGAVGASILDVAGSRVARNMRNKGKKAEMNPHMMKQERKSNILPFPGLRRVNSQPVTVYEARGKVA